MLREAAPMTRQDILILNFVAREAKITERTMSKFLTSSLAFGLFLTAMVRVAAQGYVIQTPGQLPTNVTPTPGGGYIMQTPGQSPTNVTPMPNGGYIVQTPGQLPTNINPMPGGGYRVQTPGR
jgi:hypothetical protein